MQQSGKKTNKFKGVVMKVKFKTLITLTVAVILAVAAGITKAETVDATRTVLRVQNLSCGSCLSKINAELQGLDGMINMDADLRQGVVMVDHQAPLTAKTVAFVISDLGYPATVLSDTVVQLDDEQSAGQKQKATAGFGCGGCSSGGCAVNTSSAVNASTWRKVYQRYFGNNSKPQN